MKMGNAVVKWSIGIIGSFSVALLIPYFIAHFHRERIKLYYQSTERNKEIVKICEKYFEKEYSPHFILHFSDMFHSALAQKFPAAMISYTREIMKLEDEGTVAIDWVINNKDKDEDDVTRPVVLLFPGFEGESSTCYIRKFIGDCLDTNWRIGVFHFRGHGGLKLTSAMYNNVADINDLRFAIEFTSKCYPHAPIIPVGFSMGSNVLTKYLGVIGEKVPEKVITGVSLSNPYDLFRLNRHQYEVPFVRRNLFRISQQMTLKKMKQKIWENKEVFEKDKRIIFDEIMKSTCLPEFSKSFSCILYGFNSFEEYYRAGSCINFIEGIKTPLFMLSALDDPLVPEHLIPIEKLRTNPNIILGTTKKGGHLAWLDNRGNCWMNRIAIDYIKGVLTLYHNKK